MPTFVFSENAYCVGIKYLNSLSLHRTNHGNVKAQSEVAFRMANDLACHMMVSVCLLGSNFKYPC